MSNSEPKLPAEIWVNHFTEDAATRFRDEVRTAVMLRPGLPVIVYIDSYGGDASSLVKMLDTIDSFPDTKFITVTMGKAMSCGAILFSHGDYRMISKRSEIMIHRVQSIAWGDTSELKSRANNAERKHILLNGLLATNVGLTFEQLDQKIRDADGQEIFLNAQEAVEFGIADAIGLPKLEITTTFEATLIPEKPEREPTTETKPKRKTRTKRKSKR
jgi:ATP-dependent protease ClpP protease subunit